MSRSIRSRRSKKVDHNATDLAKLRDATLRYAKDIEDHVKGINQRLGKDAVLIVPVGMAAVALREKIIKGEAPGLKQQSDLFRDNWGHAQTPLQFLSSYCHFAVIYRKQPGRFAAAAAVQRSQRHERRGQGEAQHAAPADRLGHREPSPDGRCDEDRGRTGLTGRARLCGGIVS
jgi:hypothetical protein